MDLGTALREVLKFALIQDGLSQGHHETTKTLDKRQALLCILTENCDEPTYKKLLQTMCQEHQIPLSQDEAETSEETAQDHLLRNIYMCKMHHGKTLW